MATTVTEAPPAPARGRNLKKVLAAVAAAAILAGGAAAKLGLLPGGAPAPPGPPREGAVVEVAQMTAHLAGPPGHYARVGIAVVLAEGVDVAAIEPRYPLLKDAALDVITAHHPDRLRGPDGADSLRQQLSTRARELYHDGEVVRVVLTELIVQ